MGIWSRYPFVPNERPAGVRWQQVVVSIDGRALRLVNFHPFAPDPLIVSLIGGISGPIALDTGQRSADVEAAIRALQDPLSRGDALVLAGDLNMSDQTPEYRRLTTAGLMDVYRQAGFGFGATFPSRPISRRLGVPVPPGPILRIDYVLIGGPLAVRSARVWPDAGGSDHFPVVVDLAWR
jgi:endonuclease/exonuclease/phosphatase (EEP) superfamily protein YafD